MNSEDAPVCEDGLLIARRKAKKKVPPRKRASLRSRIRKASEKFTPSISIRRWCESCEDQMRRCNRCRRKRIARLYSEKAPTIERIELHPIFD